MEAGIGDIEKRILKSNQRGYLTMGCDLRVSPVQSDFLNEIFGKKVPAGAYFWNVVPFSQSDKPKVLKALERFFDSEGSPKGATQHDIFADIPKTVALGSQLLSVSLIPLLDAQDSPEELAIELSDVTAEETKRRLRSIEREHNERLIRILTLKEAFLIFLKQADTDVELLDSGVSLSEARVILHTMKGNAGAFALTEITDTIHDIEDSLNDHGANEVNLSAAAIEIASLIDTFLHNNFSILGISRGDHQFTGFRISERELRSLEDLAERLEPVDSKEDMLRGLKRVRTLPAGSFLTALEGVVDRIATSTSKKIVFEISGQGIRVSPYTAGTVLRQIVHLVTNSCAHGIEPPEERVAKGKPRFGAVSLNVVEIGGDRIEIIVEDDGKGIDIDKVVEVALQREIIQPDEAARLSTQEKACLVFGPGVSTSKSVSKFSGRGVGLTSLKHKIDQLGGEIKISTTPGQGTQFRVTIPQFVDDPRAAGHSEAAPTWEREMETGIPELDAEHKQLISYVQDVLNLQAQWAREGSVPPKEIRKALSNLLEYSRLHIANEEAMMMKIHYADYEAHAQIHRTLMEHLEKGIRSFDPTNIASLTQFSSFVANWWAGHIRGADRKYGEALAGKKIEWNEKLSVGEERMDAQHKMLVGYVNDLESLGKRALAGQLRDFSAVRNLLGRLYEYTDLHFKEEELLMETHGFPGTDQHKKLHRHLILDLNRLKIEFEDDPIAVIPKLTSFLGRWLKGHILGVDMMYAEHIQERQYASSPGAVARPGSADLTQRT